MLLYGLCLRILHFIESLMFIDELSLSFHFPFSIFSAVSLHFFVILYFFANLPDVFLIPVVMKNIFKFFQALRAYPIARFNIAVFQVIILQLAICDYSVVGNIAIKRVASYGFC